MSNLSGGTKENIIELVASKIKNVPNGEITSYNVQGSLNELDNKKVSKSILTTKGDILVSDGTSIKNLNVGSNNQVLTADSYSENGVKWDNSFASETNITVNNSLNYIKNLYDVAIINRIGSYSFDFFEDKDFIFNSENGHIRIKAKGNNKNISAIGFNLASTTNSLPMTSPSTYTQNRVIQGGYTTVSTTTYTTITNEAISSDFDDFQKIEVISNEVNKLYRITATGGNKLKFIVERFNPSVLPDNIKILLDS
tara:strand:+ start:723 stop:1484 length:762 start_codon:yes stop_codon:yes gene_type:complete